MQHAYKITEAAKSLGIKPYLLRRWIKKSEEAESEPFRGNGKLTTEQTEIRCLREEVTRLTMEKESLKKGLLCQRNEVKYSFITRNKKTWPVNKMCHLLGVTPSVYYSFERIKRLWTVDHLPYSFSKALHLAPF